MRSDTASSINYATSSACQSGWASFMKTLSRQHEVKFVFGEKARTTGSVIYLPSLPIDLSSDYANLVRACAYHEMGHVKFSDLAYFRSFSKKYGPFASSLLNAIEDPWMEVKATCISKHAENSFKKSTTFLHKNGMASLGVKDGTLCADLSLKAYVLCYIYVEIVDWEEYKPLLEEAKMNFIISFKAEASELLSKINHIIRSMVPSCSSTQDNGSVALEIISLLRSEQQSDEINDLLSGQNCSDDEVVDYSDALEKKSDEAKQQGSPCIAPGCINDPKEEPGSSSDKSSSEPTPVNQDKQSLGTMINSLCTEDYKLGNDLAEHLISTERTVQTTLSGAKIDCKKIARVAYSDCRIFKKNNVNTEAKPATMLLCDASGSTRGNVSLSIAKSCYLLSKALDSIDYPLEIFSFRSGYAHPLLEVKSFSDSFTSSKGKIAAIPSISGGQTPMMEATFEAMKKLDRREENAKFLFIITDGYPFDPSSTAEQAIYLSNMFNITTFYIVIGEKNSVEEKACKWLIDHNLPFVFVTDVKYLAEKLIEQIKLIYI